MPVRLGAPTNISGLKDIVDNPIYSTGVGLLIYGMHQNGESVYGAEQGESFISRLKSWFQRNL
jgi:cell division protein FtsA